MQNFGRKEMTVTPAMKQLTHHHLNTLHVYCRLCDFGIPKKWAARIARFYEAVIHPIIYL